MEELLKEMKKRSVGNVMPISVILLIAAIVMFIINGPASLQLFAYLTGGKNFPHMVVGYSDDLKRLYHNDHNAFLALKYQQAQDTMY